MKSDAKWVLGTAARIMLMGPLMGLRKLCDAAIRRLDRHLPGG
ncbi:hypothetical protein [Paracandidimonas soli]|uniref:Uncharacterized protein n=1 Tax=Paracandidimonas soli TaxID=1917182 RepID=A0A4R3V1D4_9BURK|nr:hypothetical protein [Paracandidimonas soli]TCU97292.1 hypothetical protein EV686_106175 [Paracandidimonas soli]